jgi:hypothetical protein
MYFGQIAITLAIVIGEKEPTTATKNRNAINRMEKTSFGVITYIT